MSRITLRRPEALKLIEILDYIEGLDPEGSSRGLLEIYNQGSIAHSSGDKTLPNLHRALYDSCYPESD